MARSLMVCCKLLVSFAMLCLAPPLRLVKNALKSSLFMAGCLPLSPPLCVACEVLRYGLMAALAECVLASCTGATAATWVGIVSAALFLLATSVVEVMPCCLINF